MNRIINVYYYNECIIIIISVLTVIGHAIGMRLNKGNQLNDYFLDARYYFQIYLVLNFALLLWKLGLQVPPWYVTMLKLFLLIIF